GTVVNKIQGKDWKDYLPAAEAFTMGSTDYMRKRQMANLIFRVLLEQEGPKPILIEGTYNNVPVQETVSRKLSLYDAAQAPAAASTGLELLKTAILENNIGYLRIDGFSGSKMPDLLTQAMTRLQGTNALLIDVRFNGGGDQSGNTILSFLADHNIIRYKHRSVYSDYLLAMRPEIAFDYDYVSGKFTELADRNVKSNGVTYRKPVAVLISPNCFSACDTFVSAIQQNKLATVLGEHTGGGTGSPQVFDLPVSGHSFRYSVDQGFTAVDGGYIEGHGTAPDVVIEPTVAERMEKKDRQLEKALNWLFTKTQETAPATPAPANPTTPSPVIGMQVPDSLLTLEPAKISAPIEVEMDKQVKAATE
ncbi:MAG: S41 family peptidase, partial [Pseudobdellovibrio sp.]